MYDALKKYVSGLPSELVPEDSKLLFLEYLEKHWFGKLSLWRRAACDIRLFLADPAASLSCLASTNNLTERLFLQVQRSRLNEYLNKRISSFIVEFLPLLMRHEAVVSFATFPVSKCVLLQTTGRQKGTHLTHASLEGHERKLAEKGLTRYKEKRVHAASDWKMSGIFAVQFGKQPKPATTSAVGKPPVNTNSASQSHLHANPLCCNGATGLVQCAACEGYFHLACYELQESEVHLCLQCLCAHENADPLLAFQRHVADSSSTADDGDYSPIIDGAHEIKEEDELRAIAKGKKLSDLEPHYRRLLTFQHHKASSAIAPSVPPDANWQPILPAAAAACLVNYYEKRCSCLGFVHDGTKCSHLYAVEAYVRSRDMARKDRGTSAYLVLSRADSLSCRQGYPHALALIS
jgi:hypothetical protein